MRMYRGFFIPEAVEDICQTGVMSPNIQIESEDGSHLVTNVKLEDVATGKILMDNLAVICEQEVDEYLASLPES